MSRRPARARFVACATLNIHLLFRLVKTWTGRAPVALAAATAAVHAIANARAETALSLQERIDVETAARAS